MASHVQSAGTTFDNVTNFTYALPSNPVAGNLIVLSSARYRAGDNSLYREGDLTKSAGTATISTPSLLHLQFATEIGLAVWSFLVTGSGSLTLQVAHGGTGTFGSLFLGEFSGNFLNHKDVNYRSTQGNSTAPDTNTVTTHRVGDTVLFGHMSALNAAVVTVTPDAAFTQIGEDENGADRVIHSVMYRIVLQGTTDSASWTLGTTGNWECAILGFSEGGEFPSRMIV